MLMDDADISSRGVRGTAEKYVATAKVLDIEADVKVVVLNEREANQRGIMPGDRVELRLANGKKIAALVDHSESLVGEGQVGIFKNLAEEFGIETGDVVEIVPLPMPLSLETIRKKIDGGIMKREEIFAVIEDLMDNKLSPAEIAAWVTAMHIRGLTDEEVVHLTEAMVASGETLELGKSPIVDKHCIGGVVNNRTTMILVPIVAAAGLYIPKTSSRAITSPAGTADTMEVLANVNFTMEELKEIVLKAHGAIVWGGGMNIAPADDIMIRIRRPLHLDPRGVLLASILAKKKAVGSEHVIIDIPVGRGVKVEDVEHAKDLARDFKEIGTRLGMNMGVLITDGSEPIGNGVGPALEARDVLAILEGKGPTDLKEKGLLLAGKLLELSGKVEKGEGYGMAKHILNSGRALQKMKEIIALQGGDPSVTSKDIPVGEYKASVTAKKGGKISHIDNRAISKIARTAGAPSHKGAGIYLYKAKGDRVKKGEVLFDIYAESEALLTQALKMVDMLQPIEMEKILIEEVVEI